MALERGVRPGPYEILAPIGAGGMGEVYRALDSRLDRTVAIRLFLPISLMTRGGSVSSTKPELFPA